VGLDDARFITDLSLTTLHPWPFNDPADLNGEDITPMFKSPHLFAAVLGGHRASVQPGVYFWDEIQFYADIIDAFLGWLNRDVGGGECGGRGVDHQHPLPGLLQSYSYLMGAIGYIGAEQALCAVFSAIVCFSHRETFYYANYSFSGEAVFRLYRQSYAGLRHNPTGWRVTTHQTFFPELHHCRREILADMDYIGMSSDPSLCHHVRRNETRLRDVEVLSINELRQLETDIEATLNAAVDAAFVQMAGGFIVLSSTVFYACAVVLPCGVRLVWLRQRGVNITRNSSQLSAAEEIRKKLFRENNHFNCIDRGDRGYDAYETTEHSLAIDFVQDEATRLEQSSVVRWVHWDKYVNHNHACNPISETTLFDHNNTDVATSTVSTTLESLKVASV